MELLAAIFCLSQFTQIARAGNGPSSNYCLQKNYRIMLQFKLPHLKWPSNTHPWTAWLFDLTLVLLIENHKG